MKRTCFLLLGFSLILCSGYCQEQIQFKHFGEIKPFKRGKNYEIAWTGGLSKDVLTFQLIKGGVKVSEWVNVANTGQHEFKFPASLRPGKDYSFEVVRNGDVLFKSHIFSIKRKIPLALKFSPLVVAGIVLVILPKDDTNRLALPPSPN
mgnify:CR=1 FL=1